MRQTTGLVAKEPIKKSENNNIRKQATVMVVEEKEKTTFAHKLFSLFFFLFFFFFSFLFLLMHEDGGSQLSASISPFLSNILCGVIIIVTMAGQPDRYIHARVFIYMRVSDLKAAVAEVSVTPTCQGLRGGLIPACCQRVALEKEGGTTVPPVKMNNETSRVSCLLAFKWPPASGNKQKTKKKKKG